LKNIIFVCKTFILGFGKKVLQMKVCFLVVGNYMYESALKALTLFGNKTNKKEKKSAFKSKNEKFFFFLFIKTFLY
jgi:hypothetical protein